MRRDDLMAQLALIERQLQSSDEPTADLVNALVDVAHALSLPVAERRAETLNFVGGVTSIETATWSQCGGLLHALTEGDVPENRELASRVAQRIFELVPTHSRTVHD